MISYIQLDMKLLRWKMVEIIQAIFGCLAIALTVIFCTPFGWVGMCVAAYCIIKINESKKNKNKNNNEY